MSNQCCVVVRFVSASQPHAGDVLNAVPMRREFRVPTWAMRIIVQRRLGLPLDASGEPTCTARGGRVQDPMGDAASNIGRAGHNQRHQTGCCGSLCSSYRACGARWSRWCRLLADVARPSSQPHACAPCMCSPASHGAEMR